MKCAEFFSTSKKFILCEREKLRGGAGACMTVAGSHYVYDCSQYCLQAACSALAVTNIPKHAPHPAPTLTICVHGGWAGRGEKILLFSSGMKLLPAASSVGCNHVGYISGMRSG